MQSGRVAPVDNSRKEERKREKVKEEMEGKKEEERKKKSLDHGVKGLRAAYFMRLRRTY